MAYMNEGQAEARSAPTEKEKAFHLDQVEQELLQATEENGPIPVISYTDANRPADLLRPQRGSWWTHGRLTEENEPTFLEAIRTRIKFIAEKIPGLEDTAFLAEQDDFYIFESHGDIGMAMIQLKDGQIRLCLREDEVIRLTPTERDQLLIHEMLHTRDALRKQGEVWNHETDEWSTYRWARRAQLAFEHLRKAA